MELQGSRGTTTREAAGAQSRGTRCRRAPGMDDALGDAFAVELGEFLQQVVIFEQDWAALPHLHTFPAAP